MTDDRCGITQSENLGMRGRVAGQFPFVVAASDDHAVANHDGSDRDVVVRQRRASLSERQRHRARIAYVSRSFGADMAEGVGFEPTEACTSHAFQACRFGRSRTPPGNHDTVAGDGSGRQR